MWGRGFENEKKKADGRNLYFMMLLHRQNDGVSLVSPEDNDFTVGGWPMMH